MGKETGFLELDRKDRTYDDAARRIKHYKEFVIPHGENTL
jgi:glutamate synthase (NADPH/NADH) small chain